jgi:hypothetical protein
MDESDVYRILLDEDWSLEDLYVFPRAFEQVYFFVSSLDETVLASDRERVMRAYSSLPWQGGYSAVNFYNQLRYAIPRRERPTIASMQKSSPGWLDLYLIAGVAIAVAKIVKSTAIALREANSTYHDIYKGMQERKLLRIKVGRESLQLREAEINFVIRCSNQLAHVLGFSKLNQLNDYTGDPYLTLKILMSLYRRLRVLAEYENKGKALMTEDNLLPPLTTAISRKTKAGRTKRKRRV